MIIERNSFYFTLPSKEKLIEEVISHTGYAFMEPVEEEVLIEIHRAVEIGLKITEPEFCHGAAHFARCDKGIIYGKDIKISSQKLAGLIDKICRPEMIFSFIVTAGEKFDSGTTSVQAENFILSYLLDVAGSVLVESFADQLEEEIINISNHEGYNVTSRFSPGYCDWDLKDGQDEIFSFLQPGTIGINRTKGGMMHPQKTISAIMISAADIPVKTPCTFCSANNCSYRR